MKDSVANRLEFFHEKLPVEACPPSEVDGGLLEKKVVF